MGLKRPIASANSKLIADVDVDVDVDATNGSDTRNRDLESNKKPRL